jgi:cell division septation protein DedD
MRMTLGMMASVAMLAGPARADTKAGVDAWTRAEAAMAAGDKLTARKEYASAIREWQTQADKGDPDAQFNLGQAYKWGKGVPQDLTRAELLFYKASQRGHLDAADNYGLLLFQRGQHAQAMPYIQSAADRGEKRALYLLGVAHFNGENVPKDWVRAYALETLAAQTGPSQTPLAQAVAALAQMDHYVSLEDRQRGVSLSSELSQQIEANRTRQFASVDLGTQQMSPPPAAMTATPPPPPPAARSTATPKARAAQLAEVTPGKAPAQEKPAAAKAAPLAAAKPVPVATGGAWKIQFGAFGVAANADAQWAKVKGLPEVTGHPRVNAPTGKVTRLLAGGYSEDSAKAACRKLAAAGVTCLPARD